MRKIVEEDESIVEFAGIHNGGMDEWRESKVEVGDGDGDGDGVEEEWGEYHFLPLGFLPGAGVLRGGVMGLDPEP